MRKSYQRKARKSNHKFEVVGGQELLARVPLPMAEVWAEIGARGRTRRASLPANLAGDSRKRSHPASRTTTSTESERRLCAI